MEIDKQLEDLKKEIIEARNLVIKSDNQIKNLYAELKLVSRKQEGFERQHLITGLSALLLVAALCAGGAVFYATSERAAARAEAGADAAKARDLVAQVKQLTDDRDARRQASDRAAKIFAELSEKEGPARSAAVQQAAKAERTLLSTLEARALDDKIVALRAEVASAALERGRVAFRHQEMPAAAESLQRYLDTTTGEPESSTFFALGDARFVMKDFAGAVTPLERFVKSPPGTKNVDYATYILGQAYEQLGNGAKAVEIYRNGSATFSASQFAPLMRARIRKVQQSTVTPDAGTAPGR